MRLDKANNYRNKVAAEFVPNQGLFQSAAMWRNKQDQGGIQRVS
jgi:hypothetical protein